MNEQPNQPQPSTFGMVPDQQPAEPVPAPTSEPVVKQLDTIIANVTNYATPVLREIAARAAELAAKAGQAAGPIAQKAADRTGEVGDRVATKSRAIATDLRADKDSPSGPGQSDDASSDHPTPAS